MNVRHVPFMDLHLDDDAPDVRAAVERVLASGWFVLGPEVEAFEKEFAAASGAPYAVGTGNGTDALAIALRAAGVGPGDDVITTSLSAAYTALAIVMAGARPVFADIDPERLTLDPARVDRAVTSRTKAIVPVHLYGQPAEMHGLMSVASAHNVPVVEDCCQAHLATAGGQAVGTFGVAGAFSFYPTKNLGALGDGGAIITRDATLAERMKRLRNGGQTDRYHHQELGVNSRLDELQAAILRSRLPRLRTWTGKRRALAAEYRRLLTGTRVRVPPELDAGHTYHLFPIRTTQRSALQDHLRSSGIETLVHYPVPLPRQPAFAGFDPADCPHADRAADEVLSLPLYPRLPLADVSVVVDAIRAFDRRQGKELAS